jgi:hypothetical protein
MASDMSALRAMKVQDVMLQAMAKKITWWQAAEILCISDLHMRRWRERYVEEGYNGLLDRRLGKPSHRRVPVAMVEKVFALYREKYFDLNVQHFPGLHAGRCPQAAPESGQVHRQDEASEYLHGLCGLDWRGQENRFAGIRCRT